MNASGRPPTPAPVLPAAPLVPASPVVPAPPLVPATPVVPAAPLVPAPLDPPDPVPLFDLPQAVASPTPAMISAVMPILTLDMRVPPYLGCWERPGRLTSWPSPQALSRASVARKRLALTRRPLVGTLSRKRESGTFLGEVGE